MRIFAACLATETNTFSPIPTGLSDFNPVRSIDPTVPAEGHMLSVLYQHGKDCGDEVIFSLSAFAEPAGITVRSAYEELRDEILRDLQAAGPVNIVLLLLHGAMVADGYDDCEGDMIALVRQQVGSDVVIAVELDLHCHISQQAVDDTDIIITFKEYPHIDINDRAIELYDLACRASRGEVNPTTALVDCNMIGLYPTFNPPMCEFVKRMTATERQDKILSVSFAHGFPWGDVPYTDGKVMVITDNDPKLASDTGKSLANEIFALRHEIGFQSLPMEEAMSKAMASDKHPVVVADQSDNAGGGAPSDSTFALRWLLEHSVQNAAIAIFYDPHAVKMAKIAGPGATLPVRLGGKVGPASGDPLDLEVSVLAVTEEHVNQFPQLQGEPMKYPLGNTVALHCRGVDIIVSSLRSQCYSPKIFEDFGIDPTKKHLLIPKSMNHFAAAFAPIAGEIIYMAAPGAVAPIIERINYKHMPTADKFPWEAKPRH